uniref:Putative conserved secreted protein n=1 Tax=Panstrongylus lignarius TaxID=156445 RepID=A0A224XSW6_9HEMI
MWRSLVFHSIVIIALIYEVISRSELAFKDPIFVEINPKIFRSKNVMKFEAKSKRLKRGKFEEKPSLILQFTPEFFSNQKLHDLYTAITGIDGKAISDSMNKNDQQLNEETKIVFQINPLMIPGINLKRQIKDMQDKENNLAAFSLNINPLMPRRVPGIRNFSKHCYEKPAHEVWCKSQKQYSKCPATEPYPTTTRKCMPIMPNKSEINDIMNSFCTLDWSDHCGSKDPCAECPTEAPIITTPYTACKSSPPPTVKPTMCITDVRTCHCLNITHPTQPEIITLPPPMVTQKCEPCNRKDKSNLIEGKSDKYFILVKRSPQGTWSRTLRKKREHVNKHFKYYLVPVINRTGIV